MEETKETTVDSTLPIDLMSQTSENPELTDMTYPKTTAVENTTDNSISLLDNLTRTTLQQEHGFVSNDVTIQPTIEYDEKSITPVQNQFQIVTAKSNSTQLNSELDRTLTPKTENSTNFSNRFTTESVNSGINEVTTDLNLEIKTSSTKKYVTDSIWPYTSIGNIENDYQSTLDSDELQTSSTNLVETTAKPYTKKYHDGFSTPVPENKNTKTPENQRKLNNNNYTELVISTSPKTNTDIRANQSTSVYSNSVSENKFTTDSISLPTTTPIPVEIMKTGSSYEIDSSSVDTHTYNNAGTSVISDFNQENPVDDRIKTSTTSDKETTQLNDIELSTTEYIPGKQTFASTATQTNVAFDKIETSVTYEYSTTHKYLKSSTSYDFEPTTTIIYDVDTEKPTNPTTSNFKEKDAQTNSAIADTAPITTASLRTNIFEPTTLIDTSTTDKDGISILSTNINSETTGSSLVSHFDSMINSEKTFTPYDSESTTARQIISSNPGFLQDTMTTQTYSEANYKTSTESTTPSFKTIKDSEESSTDDGFTHTINITDKTDVNKDIDQQPVKTSPIGWDITTQVTEISSKSDLSKSEITPKISVESTTEANIQTSLADGTKVHLKPTGSDFATDPAAIPGSENLFMETTTMEIKNTEELPVKHTNHDFATTTQHFASFENPTTLINDILKTKTNLDSVSESTATDSSTPNFKTITEKSMISTKYNQFTEFDSTKDSTSSIEVTTITPNVFKDLLQPFTETYEASTSNSLPYDVITSKLNNDINTKTDKTTILPNTDKDMTSVNSVTGDFQTSNNIFTTQTDLVTANPKTLTEPAEVSLVTITSNYNSEVPIFTEFETTSDNIGHQTISQASTIHYNPTKFRQETSTTINSLSYETTASGKINKDTGRISTEFLTEPLITTTNFPSITKSAPTEFESTDTVLIPKTNLDRYNLTTEPNIMSFDSSTIKKTSYPGGDNVGLKTTGDFFSTQPDINTDNFEYKIDPETVPDNYASSEKIELDTTHGITSTKTDYTTNRAISIESTTNNFKESLYVSDFETTQGLLEIQTNNIFNEKHEISTEFTKQPFDIVTNNYESMVKSVSSELVTTSDVLETKNYYTNSHNPSTERTTMNLRTTNDESITSQQPQATGTSGKNQNPLEISTKMGTPLSETNTDKLSPTVAISTNFETTADTSVTENSINNNEHTMVTEPSTESNTIQSMKSPKITTINLETTSTFVTEADMTMDSNKVATEPTKETFATNSNEILTTGNSGFIEAETTQNIFLTSTNEYTDFSTKPTVINIESTTFNNVLSVKPISNFETTEGKTASAEVEPFTNTLTTLETVVTSELEQTQDLVTKKDVTTEVNLIQTQTAFVDSVTNTERFEPTSNRFSNSETTTITEIDSIPDNKTLIQPTTEYLKIDTIEVTLSAITTDVENIQSIVVTDSNIANSNHQTTAQPITFGSTTNTIEDGLSTPLRTDFENTQGTSITEINTESYKTLTKPSEEILEKNKDRSSLKPETDVTGITTPQGSLETDKDNKISNNTTKRAPTTNYETTTDINVSDVDNIDITKSADLSTLKIETNTDKSVPLVDLTTVVLETKSNSEVINTDTHTFSNKPITADFETTSRESTVTDVKTTPDSFAMDTKYEITMSQKPFTQTTNQDLESTIYIRVPTETSTIHDVTTEDLVTESSKPIVPSVLEHENTVSSTTESEILTSPLIISRSTETNTLFDDKTNIETTEYSTDSVKGVMIDYATENHIKTYNMPPPNLVNELDQSNLHTSSVTIVDFTETTTKSIITSPKTTVGDFETGRDNIEDDSKTTPVPVTNVFDFVTDSQISSTTAAMVTNVGNFISYFNTFTRDDKSSPATESIITTVTDSTSKIDSSTDVFTTSSESQNINYSNKSIDSYETNAINLKPQNSTISTSTESLSSRRKDIDIPAWTDSTIMTDSTTTETYNLTTNDLQINIPCKINSHCPVNKTCLSGVCQNPCDAMRIQCAENHSCKIVDHVAVCTCDYAAGNNCLRGMHFHLGIMRADFFIM